MEVFENLLPLVAFAAAVVGVFVQMWLSDQIEQRLRSRHPQVWEELSDRPQLPPLRVASFVHGDQAWLLGDEELVKKTVQARWAYGITTATMVVGVFWVFSQGSARAP